MRVISAICHVSAVSSILSSELIPQTINTLKLFSVLRKQQYTVFSIFLRHQTMTIYINVNRQSVCHMILQISCNPYLIAWHRYLYIGPSHGHTTEEFQRQSKQSRFNLLWVMFNGNYIWLWICCLLWVSPPSLPPQKIIPFSFEWLIHIKQIKT